MKTWFLCICYYSNALNCYGNINIIFFKVITHIWSLPSMCIFVFNRYLEFRVRIAIISVITTILILKKLRWARLLNFFLLFFIEKKLLVQNDVKFYFNIWHALVSFSFLWIMNKKRCKVNHAPPANPQNWYLSVYIVPNSLF